jgi:phosphatidylinositol glycan class U
MFSCFIYAHRHVQHANVTWTVKEGLWFYQHDVDPYAGGVFRHVSDVCIFDSQRNLIFSDLQSPLLLSLFSAVLPPVPVVWALSDIVGAWALLRIWRARQRVSKGPSSRDSLVAAVYLLNPYLLLPSLALSTSTFENTVVLLTLMLASQGVLS